MNGFYEIFFVIYLLKQIFKPSKRLFTCSVMCFLLTKKYCRFILSSCRDYFACFTLLVTLLIFVFENFFVHIYIHEKGMAYSNIMLLWRSVVLNSFSNSSYREIKLKTCITHLKNTILNVTHKGLITKLLERYECSMVSSKVWTFPFYEKMVHLICLS